MAIYTGVADANGDFTVPFSSNYTGGQKITVIAEKDSATKSIELFAPTSVTGGGPIQFSGTMVDFPNNIGNVTLATEIQGIIPNACFADTGNYYSLFSKAKGLIIDGIVTIIKNDAFKNWGEATLLTLPDSLTRIENNAFYGWSKLVEIRVPNSVTFIGDGSFGFPYACKKLTIGSGVESIGIAAFTYMTSCDEIILLPATPPTISTNTFMDVKSSCVFKVPAASLNAYQSASNWSAYAGRMIGV